MTGVKPLQHYFNSKTTIYNILTLLLQYNYCHMVADLQNYRTSGDDSYDHQYFNAILSY